MALTSEFERTLREQVQGEIAFDELTRGIYATDASHYQIVPTCVVTPVNAEDAVAAIRVATEHAVPITARGGGTSLSGQSSWTGMVLDLSRHMNQILEINVEQGWARVEPGVVRDQLNDAVSHFGLHFAPDPATTSRATIGGMIANNSSGTRSIVYGKTMDHVLECTVALPDGARVRCRDFTQDQWRSRELEDTRQAQIMRGVREIVETNREEIQKRYPKVMRRVSGYNLDEFTVAHASGELRPWNLSHLIVGSEGTLATLLEAKVQLTPTPAATSLCVVHFADVFEAMRAVHPMLAHQPSAIELLDDKVMEESRKNPTTARLATAFEGAPRAVLIVEFSATSELLATTRAEEFSAEMRRCKIGYAWPTKTQLEDQCDIWELRKLGLGLIENKPGKRGKACIEDTCVPVEDLEPYSRRVYEICERHGIGLISYAHASVGVIHFRPELDLKLPEDVQKMRHITEEVFQLVKEFVGSFASEHGDGIVRGEFVPRFFGEQLYQAFRKIKALFDPTGVMNPGKIVDAPAMTEHLRYGNGYRPQSVATIFHYRDHGSMQAAVEQCSGVGACRKLAAGTMCPSYRATRDERHSTRGRANALRMAISGQLSDGALTSDRMLDTLRLCLACKACKSECPTSVDVARFKAEVFQMRYDRDGVPQSARLIANLPSLLRRLPLPIMRIGNWLQSKLGLDPFVMRKMGFDARRTLPRVAAKSFATQFAEHIASNHRDWNPHGRVLMFVDTFTNYFEPEIGMAAVRLLEGCGYAVRLAEAGCCQRTAISQGLLRRARTEGAKTVKTLAQTEPELPIIVLEPSCVSSLYDDLPDLIEDHNAAQSVRQRVRLLEAFLDEQFEAGALANVRLRSRHRAIAVHGHCHQKSLFGMASLTRLLQRIPGLEWSMIDAGCCGMAGSFGFEHYDISMKVAEERLLPALRKLPRGTQVVATGTSCRQQVHDLTDMRAIHWSQCIEASTVPESGSTNRLS